MSIGICRALVCLVVFTTAHRSLGATPQSAHFYEFNTQTFAPGIKLRRDFLVDRMRADRYGLPAPTRSELLQMHSGLLNASLGTCACSTQSASMPSKPLGQITLKDFNGRKFAVSVTSFEFALKIFQFLDGKRRHGEWPRFEGCYAQAEQSAFLLEKRGVLVGKIMATGSFQILSEDLKGGSVVWGFHVAPIVVVDEGEKRGVWVLDPALFSEPVPVETWLALLVQNPRAKLEEVFFTNRFVFHPRNKKLRLGTWRTVDLKLARSILDQETEK